MHIMLVISSLGSGGAEKILSNLANHFISKNHRISIITLISPETKPFYPLNSNIKILQLNQSSNTPKLIIRVINILKRVFCLRKTIKQLQPDIVISFLDTINITTLLASWGLKFPIIVSERIDPKYHHFPFLYQKIRKFIYKKANYVVMQTKSAANYFNNLSNIIIIPNAVHKPIVTNQLNNDSIQKIVSVGRLCCQKSFPTLIYAFAKLVKQYPNLVLTIYGEGEERSNLERLIVSLNLQNKVFLPGVTNNIQEALSKSDLFIFPSQYEGFPNALCEAMAYGLPVIASNCSGNIDIVRDGTDGRLFPVGNIEALTNITLELIKDPEQCRRLSENAKTIYDRFDASRIYSLWDKLIDNCKINPTM